MPGREPHDREADFHPESGLPEDIFDESLRRRRQLIAEERQRLREEARRPLDEDDDEAADTAPYDDPDFGPKVWRRAYRVTSTEISLFLGGYLIRQPWIRSNVNAWLSGNELEPGDRQFDVVDFAVRKLGFLPRPGNTDDWRGNYIMKGARHRLVLMYDRFDPCITVRLASRKRLVIFAAGGRVHSRGQAESGILRELIGRAARWEHATPNDILAVCVPESEQFRKAVARWDQSEGARRLGLRFLTVERSTGAVTGLESIVSP